VILGHMSTLEEGGTRYELILALVWAPQGVGVPGHKGMRRTANVGAILKSSCQDSENAVLTQAQPTCMMMREHYPWLGSQIFPLYPRPANWRISKIFC
jgi:hypothetical protein